MLCQREHARELGLSRHETQVRKLTEKLSKEKEKRQGVKEKSCKRCLLSRCEGSERCPAKTRNCNKCGELGHFSKSVLCKGKAKAMRKVQEEESSEEEVLFMICYVPSRNNATWLPIYTESKVHDGKRYQLYQWTAKVRYRQGKHFKPHWLFIILEHDIYSVYQYQ